MMNDSRFRVFAFLALVLFIVHVRCTPASQQDCSSEVQERIQACLDQVEHDEAALNTGFCTSTDWKCICTKQQGIGDCYSLCADLIPADKVNFDRDNCAGQHQGVRIIDLGGTLMYTWSDLNVPLSNGIKASSTNMTASASSSTASSTSKTEDDQDGNDNDHDDNDDDDDDDHSTTPSSSSSPQPAANDSMSHSPPTSSMGNNVTTSPAAVQNTANTTSTTHSATKNIAPRFKAINGTAIVVVTLTLIFFAYASL